MMSLERGKIVIGLVIDCTAEEAWRLLTDTHQWPRWGPSVTKVECEQRFIGPDSEGRVKTLLGFWVPFAIDEYRDLSYWSWRIGRITATGHRIDARDEISCVVAFEMPWWALPYAAVCRIALGRIRGLLASND